MKEWIRHIFPLKKKQPEVPEDGWFGNYASWHDAQKKCSGYNQSEILDKVRAAVLKVMKGEAAYERDSVVFETFEYSEELLAALKATVKNNELNIIDFGGSLGSEYFQYRRFFDGIAINWMVVEQHHFVECGKKEIAGDQLKFFYTIEEAMHYKKANTILFSSVLPYIEAPLDLIDKVKSMDFGFIIIDRNSFIEGPDRLTVQVVPESIYKASYPAWFFNEQKFVSRFTDNYELKSEFMSPFSPPAMVDRTRVYWKGFLFKKKA